MGTRVNESMSALPAAKDGISDDDLRTINRVTGLSTDFLNQYNEVVMLIDMLPDMPDMVEEIVDWRPHSYVDHFANSKLLIGPKAVACYADADPDVRDRFDAAANALDEFLLGAIPILADLVEKDEIEALREVARETAEFAKRTEGYIGAIINGARADVIPERRVREQTEELIDALF